MKRLLYALLALMAILIIVILVRTFAFTSRQSMVAAVTMPEIGDESISRLSQAVTFRTISFAEDLPADTSAFLNFHAFLNKSYPLVHSTLECQTISNLSLLYKWEGKNPSLKPFILCAHMDVVPSGDSTLWENPPYSGVIDKEFIWGRGTLDDKIAIIGILEAAEKLIAQDFKPERTVYFAFGHDEEINGIRGAYAIASLLKESGVEAEFVLDEGLAVTNGIVPMINKPVATIGTSEKGYLTVKLRVRMEGGHSSTPAKETAINVLCTAIEKINKTKMDSFISGPVSDFMDYAGPEMPFYARIIFANRWLFKPLILSIYEGTPAGNAAVRTLLYLQ